MANTTRLDVIESFESLFADQHIIPEGLENRWFIDSLAEYEMENRVLGYNPHTASFSSALPSGVVTTLAYLMKIRYCEREVSRVNKINNLYTKDVQLNGNGDTKRYSAAELTAELNRARDFINKQKVSYYS